MNHKRCLIRCHFQIINAVERRSPLNGIDYLEVASDQTTLVVHFLHPLAATTQFLVRGALEEWLGDLITVEEIAIEPIESQLEVKIQYIVRRTQERQVATFVRRAGDRCHRVLPGNCASAGFDSPSCPTAGLFDERRLQCPRLDCVYGRRNGAVARSRSPARRTAADAHRNCQRSPATRKVRPGAESGISGV
ncbi:hypothetical protein [Leptolyngbya ohadii]|uniref:hypothetical protein n=1 Tax=Leptolyngbya ohadii TaxID=1962290 RepID=UPI001CEC2F61|nr:hypothetical protein [Leptolyngbya ohadii]